MTGPRRQRARGSWPGLAGSLALVAALVVCVPLAFAARANAFVYWPWSASSGFDPGPSGVGRANLDGTGVDQSFVTFDGKPVAVAVDGAHVYWLNQTIGGSSIGRANLDGTGVEPSFIAGLGYPNDLAVDDAHIYWADFGGIGRANLDGTGLDPSFIDPPRDVGYDETFYGVAISAANIYWAFQETGPASGRLPTVPAIRSIGCANTDGSRPNYELVPANALNVALDGGHVYWTTAIGIGRANLDGTAAQEGFIPASGDAGVALDAAHIYWSNGNIGRANLDGSGADQTFIAGVDARDVAVDGPQPGSPGPSSCPPPPPPPPPGNSFSLGKLDRNPNKGTAKLRVRVPGAGKLRLKKTKRVRRDADRVPGGSKVWLKVRPRPKAKKRLADHGKVTVSLHVIYTPTGGVPNTESKKGKLRRR